MPSKNKSITHTNLSIHLFVNGFSFYTPSRTEFNPITKNIGDFESALEGLLNFYPKEIFSGAQIISYHQPSTFVPIKFFDKNLLKNYLQILGNIDDNSAINFDLLKEESQVNVYSYPKIILKILNQQINNGTLYHYNSLLYSEVNKLSNFSEKEYQLYIHLQKGAMDLYLTKNSYVIFQNHFGIKNKDEFLYYVFYIVEQYKLSSDQFEIVFLGEIRAFKTYYQSIKEFHQIIRFEDREICSKIDIEQHPAPFFAKSPE
tara:strand:+ start:1120 stop:1896 length:777 start_codon:yes stop_codon:yes gene_type:complete